MASKPSTYSGAKRVAAPPRSSKAYGRTWRRFRAAIVQERVEQAMQVGHSPCADCASEGKRWLASDEHPWELHHQRPITTHPELKYEPSNVVLLCKSCHRTRENRAVVGSMARIGRVT